MKRKQLLTKTFLIAAMLFVGMSAWADETETVQVLSENYESYTAGDIKSTMQSKGWTFAAKNTSYPNVYIIQGNSEPQTTKYLSMVYADGGAERTQYWVFPEAARNALNADNWTLTFDAAVAPGTNTNWRLAVSGTNSSNCFNSTATPSATGNFLYLQNAESGSTSYSAYVAGTSAGDAFTLTSETWYKFTIKATNINTVANTATIYVKITSYDGNTTLAESTQTNVSMTDFGTLKGINWFSPKKNNSKLFLDNVLLTKEVDASICSNPTYNLTGVNGTSRKYSLACETAGSTIYYAYSELEKGANGWDEYNAEITTDATTIYAYAKRGNITSEIINFATGAGSEVSLNEPFIFLTGMSENGEYFNPIFNSSSDQSSVLLTPQTTLSATFNGETVTLPYTITSAGKLTVTASAEGYKSSSANFEYSINPLYSLSKSADFSSINSSNISSSLGGSWTISDEFTRWSNWSKSGGVNTDGTANNGASYYTASTSSSFPLVVSDFVSLNTNGTLLLIGWGFGRNNGTANFSISNVAPLSIAQYTESDFGGTDYNRYVISQDNLPMTTYTGGVIRKVKYYAITTTASISSYGYATFSSTYALDFTNVDNAKAYIVTGQNATGTSVIMEQVTGTVAAGTGLVLESNNGDEATVTIPIVAEGISYDTNKLWAITEDGNVSKADDDSYTNYVLSVQDNKVVFASIDEVAAPIKAGQAALCLPNTTPAKSLSLSPEQVTTGINTVQGSGVKVNGYYDLQGRRVSQPTKGLYIMDGKKIIIK